MSKKIIVVAGGTGNLGGRIIKALLGKGAEVRDAYLQRSRRNRCRTAQLQERMGQCPALHRPVRSHLRARLAQRQARADPLHRSQ